MNTGFTAGGQLGPRVARDAAGDFVVVWASFDQASSTSSYDIYGQRYNAAGQPQGSEFLVNTVNGGLQKQPVVAMDAAGDFTVVWESYNQAGVTSDYDIYARQYNAAGTALQANEFLVNTFTTGNQFLPSVAMDAAGDFVVAWISVNQAGATSGNDIYARQFTSAGSAVQLNEFLVNTFTTGNQKSPSVAMDAGGDFVIAWQSYRQASSTGGFDIYARQWGSNGSTTLSAVQANEFLVNTVTSAPTTANKEFPAVAMDAAGDFVVAWESYYQAGGFFPGSDIYARQFTAAGTAVQANEFNVNTVNLSNQSLPSVAADANGDFVVTWQSLNQVTSSSDYDIYGRQFTSAGTAVQASEFLVNSYTSGHQNQSSVAMDASGDFVVTWQSYGQAGTSSQYDIFARRYQGPESVDLSATLTPSPATVNTGGSFSLTLGVDNKNAALGSGNTALDAAAGAASGINAVFTIPSGATLGTTSGTNWTCGTVSGTSLSCNYSGSLAAATAASGLTLNFKAPTSTGTLSIPVSVSSTQQQSGSDNSSSATVTVKAASSSGGGGPSGGGSSGGGSSGGGGGGGAFGLFSLALLSLSLLRRRRSNP